MNGFRHVRWPQNAPGRFYVDEQCIDCDVCRDIAPALFRRDDRDAHSFVARQPATADERRVAEEARDECPVGAIGDDGDALEEPPVGQPARH